MIKIWVFMQLKKVFQRDSWKTKKEWPIFSSKMNWENIFQYILWTLFRNYWENEHPELIRNLYSILNDLREEEFKINNHFDIDNGQIFAIMDLTGAYHGSLLKSVKLFYNPTSGLWTYWLRFTQRCRYFWYLYSLIFSRRNQRIKNWV